MQPAPSTQLPDGLLAAALLLSRKPRHGFLSRNPAPHQPIDERNCTAALGLRASWAVEAARPTEHDGSYDPSNPQSFNRYSYVTNNPLSFIDPSGLLDCKYPPCDPNYGGGTTVYGNVPPITYGNIWVPGTGTGDGVSGGNGTGGGGGTGTGNSAGSSSVKATAQCAAAHASSFASLAGISNSNLLGQTLLGNDISTISNLLTGPGQGTAGVQALVSNPTPANAIYQLGKRIGSTQSSQLVLVQTASQDAFDNPQFYAKALSLAETAGGKALAEAFGLFSAAKLTYDVGAYALAYAQCSAGVIH